MKIFLVALLFFVNLTALDDMKNINLNTIDKKEAVDKVVKRIEQIKLKNLSTISSTSHQKDIELLQKKILNTIKLKEKLRASSVELKSTTKKYNEHEAKYHEKIKRIYTLAKGIVRKSYYLVSHPIDKAYTTELQNYLIDKYGVTKFEQSMVIQESSTGKDSFESVIKTTKEFGQMRTESLKDFTYRDKNLNFTLLKITQLPFVQGSSSNFSKSTDTEIDKFADSSGVKIHQLVKNGDWEEFVAQAGIADDELAKITKKIKKGLNLKKITNKLAIQSKKITKKIKKIEKEHDTQIVTTNRFITAIASLDDRVASDKLKLQDSFDDAQSLATTYSMTLKLETIDKLLLIMPKIYSEIVELGEEREFIQRKTRSFLSKISINNIKQSETLKNYYDISTTNTQQQMILGYESIHILPYIDGKKLSLFVFASIEIKEKIDESNYITKRLKFAKLQFIPVKKGYKTIFALRTELTLGVFKEFVQANKQNKYFDKYCLEDSLLPEDARDMKNLDEEFYDYPAVCYKADKLDDVVEWLSEKVGKELVIPQSEDWSYIASNASSTDYCWGNKTVEELNEDELQPENIYYENDEETTIMPIKKFKPSSLGIYDMCGNVHEMVKDGDTIMVKGNSFISYIEKSDAPAVEYGDDLSPSLGLRVFYIGDK